MLPPRPQEARQTRSSQRVAIDTPESSCASRRDDDKDQDGSDDDSDDPTYEQDELTSSQLGDAPQAT